MTATAGHPIPSESDRTVPPASACTAVLQLSAPVYRQRLFDQLEASGAPIVFYAGDRPFRIRTTTPATSPLVHRVGANRYLAGRRLVAMRLDPRALLAFGQVVVELNPRNLTSWAVLLLRRARRLPTHGWGHAEPRQPRGRLVTALRRTQDRLCTSLIVYTESDAASMRSRFPRKHVAVATNALYRRHEMYAEDRSTGDLVWIGGVEADKKPLLALEALRVLRDSGSPVPVLHLVGDGSLLDEVVATAQRYGLADTVRVHGRLSGIEELRPVFARAAAMLATGYIGLNATQSLGFGVPVVYPRDDPHAPEIEALHERNSVPFASDDAADCAATVAALLRGETGLMPRREIAEEAGRRYSVETMSAPFLAIARSAGT